MTQQCLKQSRLICLNAATVQPFTVAPHVLSTYERNEDLKGLFFLHESSINWPRSNTMSSTFQRGINKFSPDLGPSRLMMLFCWRRVQATLRARVNNGSPKAVTNIVTSRLPASFNLPPQAAWPHRVLRRLRLSQVFQSDLGSFLTPR